MNVCTCNVCLHTLYLTEGIDEGYMGWKECRVQMGQVNLTVYGESLLFEGYKCE